jgi:hypothetical protein
VVWATKASFFEYFSTAPSPQHNFNAGKADRTLKLASAHAHQFQSSDGVVCGGSFVVACCACGCGIAGPIPLPVALKVRLQWAGPRHLQLIRPWVPQDPATFPL